MTAPDYEWEMDASLEAAVSCVSLGSYCAVAAALNHLKLRSAAYPFDWNRTTIEGVIHFLDTRFSDFLDFHSVKDFPGGMDTGGKTYSGAHHSIWHENMATEEGNSKYHRRISRFFENSAPRLLFVRSMNASSELLHAQALLDILQRLFAKSRVYLLLIAPCQPYTQSFSVEGTNGQLLVHCTPMWSIDGLLYAEPIRAAYEHAAEAAGPGGAAGPYTPAVPMHCVLRIVQPYFGGHPQEVPFTPQLLYFPQWPLLVPGPQEAPPMDLPDAPMSPECAQREEPPCVEEPEKPAASEDPPAQLLAPAALVAPAAPAARRGRRQPPPGGPYFPRCRGAGAPATARDFARRRRRRAEADATSTAASAAARAPVS